MKSLWNRLKSLSIRVWIPVTAALILGIWIGSLGKRPEPAVTAHEEKSEVQWWTCSMHPQIKLPEPGKCPICFMDLIPLEVTGNDDGPRELKLSDTAVRLAEIATGTVQRGQPVAEIRLSGKIVPDERKVKTITAWVPGRLEKLFVDFTGTEVKRGDPLVELYSPALYAAQEELLQALKMKDVRGITDLPEEDLVHAVREKLSQLGLTDQQIQAVETRGTATDRLTIVSPISGVVIHKNAVEGRYVDRGSPIYTIADLSEVWAVLDAYEQDIAYLKEGQPVQFTTEAWPGRQFESDISFINPVLDEQTRSIQVRLNVPNRNALLKPGMFIRAEVADSLRSTGQLPLLIPASAVLKTGKRAVVYVKKPDTDAPVFEGREVELGPRAGDYYMVLSGLSEGESVVTKGNFKIDSALQIQAKPSMMNPEGGMTMTGYAHQHPGQKGEITSSGHDMSEMTRPRSADPAAFRKSLDPVYDAYFHAQSALANDQFEAARDAFVALRQAVTGITGAPEGQAGGLWGEIRNTLLADTEHAHHWTGIDAVRSAFSRIANPLTELESRFGHSGTQSVYRVFCPMAFDNRGAEWLQTDSTVSNPYFGSAMPRCGEIKEIYKPASN
jgi:Cu(I)/Ag(I) efflux system membrane fusion protein